MDDDGDMMAERAFRQMRRQENRGSRYSDVGSVSVPALLIGVGVGIGIIAAARWYSKRVM